MFENLKITRFAVTLIVLAAMLTASLVIGETKVFQSKVLAETLPKAEISQESVIENLGTQPVYFEENSGQFNNKVRYFTRGTKGYDLFLTATDAVYVLSSPKSEVQSPKSEDLRNPKSQIPNPKSAVAVYMTLAGANEDSTFAGSLSLEHKTNYFKGAESDWRTEIANYGQVRTNQVYEGIDMVWHGKENGGVQYDFVVEPNANPNQIEWQIKGASAVELTAEGDLLIKTEFGEIKQNKPFTFQDANGFRQEIESRFVLSEPSAVAGGLNAESFKVKFELGNYDRSKTLTIDPSVNLSNLSFSTFLGGNGADRGYGITTDRAGNVYVTGTTLSQSFPTTAGTFDTTYNNSFDVFVTKLNPTGSNLIYSTFIGGTGVDVGFGIVADTSGNAFVTGGSDSSISYPTTTGAFDTTGNGLRDVFVTKLNPMGSALVYSTFIGGNNDEEGQGIVVDVSGNAFVTGYSNDGAVDYPTTAGAFETSHNGSSDAFVTKLNPTGSALVYSTFISGTSSDSGRGIAIDASGNAFVTGSTQSTNYPTTGGAFDVTQNGGSDVFITKLNPAGSALIYSTFIGGNGTDIGDGIAVDSSGNAFITGQTSVGVPDYPTTFGAFDTTRNGPFSDVFVTKLNPTGSGLVYSTFIVGSGSDYGNGIVIDSSGNAFVTGYTGDSTTDYPTTTGAFDTTHNGNNDVFVCKLNSTGLSLIYSTFIGGSGNEEGNGIAIDSAGNVFVTGIALDGTTEYPTTQEVFQPQNNGNGDVFVTKLGDFSISGRTLDTSGLPLANTAVAMSGDNTDFMLSDAEGRFYFGDTILSGTNLVSATQILYNFNPPNFQVVTNRNKQITFVGRPTTSGPTVAFSNLGGDVQSTAGNIGLPNTNLTLIDTFGDIRTATTDAQGNYRFNNVRTGSFYIVFAERDGYNFSPAAAQVTFLDQNLDVDFTASPNSPRPVQDFDGDGKSDLAVFRPAEGNWYILQSQNNALKVVNFGVNGDVPLAEDFDGDNRADIAVYRPSDGNWYRLNSSNGAFSAVKFGLAEDKPVPADYDGDGKTDIAVYRPSNGVWHRLDSSNGNYSSVQWGISTDKPVPADFDSDGKADLTVFRNGTWYRQNSSNGQTSVEQFGSDGDAPMAADFDGDGKQDTAVYRPSNGTWYWLDNADREFHAVNFGISNDIPVPADYNGDGRFEQAIYRAGTWYQLYSNGNFSVRQFGLPTDLPVKSIR